MPKRHMMLGLVSLGMLAACQPAATELSELSAPERRLFQQASERRAAGDTGEAVQLYTQAAKLSSSSVEAHIAVAEILRSNNSAAQSLSMIESALLLQPNDARLYMEKGFALVAKSEYDAGIASFDKALKLDENLASAYSGKAVAYDLQGHHDKAQMIYSEAKARGLTSPAMENNYALSLIFSSKYDEAISMLLPHASSSYATTTMKQNLALAYGLKGDVGRAAEYGSDGLDPIQAHKNLEFYKRFTALKYGNQPARLAVSNNATNKAVPAVPVESGDIGFVTEAGKSNQVILKPKVEVIEMDAAAFEELMDDN